MMAKEANASPGFNRIPRTIWLLWFDGWEKSPELHRRCLESWELYNIGWKVRPIARRDFPKLIGAFLPEYERLRAAMNPLEQFGGFWIPPAAESDLLRLILLGFYGGVWVDSTMLCRRPLDDWLPQAAPDGFFAFAPEDIGEQLPVMSSFLASEPSHKIVNVWLKRVVKHWSTPSSRRTDLGFFWLHKLFGKIVGDPLVGRPDPKEIDEEVKRRWALVPRISGEYGVKGPHFWVKYTNTLRPPPTPEYRRIIDEERETPMWKLTNHEVKLNDVGPESCYWVLLEATRRQAREHAARLSAGGSELSEAHCLELTGGSSPRETPQAAIESRR
eukprot:CAMPEP_0176247094 /NCGR_PEP_ID=MMETSP0121_2-20121125/32780_1 /TAXON_ID=160619 /ORGANISM="Kryptoperidinium foliaceum, Strain CCMP 1326" /LENGTH=329 /DNA_ID=CAMNT_0017586743 /DNA_START=106 /DNA_END=1093 /DNA_ORIENTATION=+